MRDVPLTSPTVIMNLAVTPFLFLSVFMYCGYVIEVKLLSHVQLFATPWTVADQAPQSMLFSRHEYWNGLPFPSPGDLPDPGI